MKNEKRLIDANALSEKIGIMKFEITRNRGGYRYCNEEEKNEWDKLDSFDSLVCDAPTVDAVEVIHASWVDVRDYCGDYMCSNCKELSRTKTYNYCPNCGAKMDDIFVGFEAEITGR